VSDSFRSQRPETDRFSSEDPDLIGQMGYLDHT
jgi:hypothetical protein